MAVAIAGMVVGLGIALGVLRALSLLATENLSTGVAISMDRFVLGFTALLAVCRRSIFGLPAWRIARINPQENLKQGRGRAVRLAAITASAIFW